MYIRYKNKIYRYISEDKEIVTYDTGKIDNNFQEDDGIYYRNVEETDPNIQDIYDIRFFIKWDSHIEYVMAKWNIEPEDYKPDGRVHIYHEGHLPEWYIEEKGVCSRYIDSDDIEGYSVKYIYKMKDGQKYEEGLEVETEIDRQEFEKLIEMYENANI